MNPADRVREAARSAVVQFTALLEYLDHIAKGRDGSPHVDAEDRSALDALRSALALPFEPAKPDEVGKAREAFYEAAREAKRLSRAVESAFDLEISTGQDHDEAGLGAEANSASWDADIAYDALLAAERASSESTETHKE